MKLSAGANVIITRCGSRASTGGSAWGGETPSDVVVDEAGVAWVVNTCGNTLSRIEP